MVQVPEPRSVGGFHFKHCDGDNNGYNTIAKSSQPALPDNHEQID